MASGLVMVARTHAEDPTQEGIEFFEKKIRPILVDNCYKCHAADSEKGPKGGLLLDTRDGLFKGGDTGPAIVPGDAEKSLLIKAVRHRDENLQMPPKNGKLPDEQIADLEAWVKMGAPDPRSKNLETRSSKLATEKHWAFQPVRVPPVPAVRNRRWVQNPIDAFVLAKLEAKGMSPSRQADKRALIRRASYDLTGLPPAPEEVTDFLGDKSPEAFARVVERLLDSPRYGERWARHWLDVARYADTKGYVFEEERRYAYAYTYRDYVIRALNEDLPFDRFIIEQLAADQLELGEDKRALAAMGFLTLGRRFLNNQPDIIDDRIDVVTRGLMGLTVTCARCHDHKYDPIPTSDYYSLYGVFASCSEPSDKPLLGTVSLPKAYDEYAAERKKREDELNHFRETKQQEALTQLRQRAGDYLLAAYDTQRLEDKAKAEGLARERKLDPKTVQKWISKLDEWSKEHHPIFAPWFAFVALPEGEFATRSTELAAKYSGNAEAEKPINPLVAEVFAGQAPAMMKEVAERYGKLFADADKQWQEMVEAGKKEEKAELPAALPDPNREALRQVLYAEGSPANLGSGEFRRVFDVPTSQKVRALQRKVEELDATHPGAPPKGMVLADNAQPNNPRVFVRGNPNNPGAEVPRQFLEVVAGSNRKPFEKGSGRLELAQAIASRDNPLTARVIVNRVWLHHFGAGLVRTPSDFGVRSDPPTHPGLLDYLTAWFMDNGWSIKKLHRLIMLSSAYQQSSDDNDRFAQADPDNRLLWKMNRRRLDFESMRDSLLAVSGKLDLTEGGHSVDITTQPFTARRTVYGFVERQNLPGIFRTFDFASPDTTSPQRFATIVPQQALFLMNSPFIIQQARELAARPEVKTCQSSKDTVRALYQVAFQRPPERDEVQLGMRFLEAQSPKP
ncbi:MAG TPA: PSD1 and planctomycete cytochrome C domain-containing protein, partial [Verrucomicrobiae bacterium]|nr:PSD1 and planctomycete cytochrome C domain-containing protein [Verrucomicrobiae bacterium]